MINVPAKVWEELSKEERAGLAHYAESLIPTIRDSPERYVDIPTTAPSYASAVASTRSLCAYCWEIVTGDPVGYGDMELGDTVAQGRP